MLKSLLLLSLFSVNTYAGVLTSSVQDAANLAGFEIEPTSVYAVEVQNEGHGVEVSFYGNVNLTFACEAHGSHAHCSEEGHDHLKGGNHDEEPALQLITEGTTGVINYIETILTGRNYDVSALTYVKTWLYEDDHGHGGDAVWAKYTVDLNGRELTRCAVCHEHHGVEGIACHGVMKPQGEPTLED